MDETLTDMKADGTIDRIIAKVHWKLTPPASSQCHDI
jgi:hypothetical protein